MYHLFFLNRIVNRKKRAKLSNHRQIGLYPFLSSSTFSGENYIPSFFIYRMPQSSHEKSIEKRQRIESGAHIWGPQYWFVLLTMAHMYPDFPTTITKRKYYDFIMNLPLFLPNESMGNQFAEMLDKYPVTPYLDKRESFIRWVVFIHNKINVSLGKLELSLEEAEAEYFRKYVPEQLELYGDTPLRRTVVYMNTAIILVLLLVVYLFYRG